MLLELFHDIRYAGKRRSSQGPQGKGSLDARSCSSWPTFYPTPLRSERVLSCAFVAFSLSFIVGCADGGVGSSTVGDNPARLSISPADEFLTSSAAGNPAIPSSKVYTLRNNGSSAVPWTMTSTATWISAGLTGGTLAPGETADVNVSLDQAITATFATGFYTADLRFEDPIGDDLTVRVAYTVNKPDHNQAIPMTTATRAFGVAPLLVVFDALDTTSPLWTSGVVQPPGEDIAAFQYNWNFGDPASGTWPVSSRSRNEDTGVISAHVFEEPGEYTVTLRVTQTDGTVTVYAQEITAQAFNGTTYYVSSTGSDSNDGLTPEEPLRTFAAGMGVAATNTRILFKRGENFTTTSAAAVSAYGPGIIGSYGSGVRPTITSINPANDTGILLFSGDDWRVQDLEFIGQGTALELGSAIALAYASQMQNLLVLRADINEFFMGAVWTDAPSLPTHEVVGVVDCNIASCEEYGMFVGARHLAVLGTSIVDTEEQHALRVWQANKSVISHNLLGRCGAFHQNLKLHGPSHSGDPGRLPSEFIQIADNEILGVNTWSVGLGPQNSTSDERVRGVVVERNRFYDGGADLLVWARQVTVRNNIFHGHDDADDYVAVIVERRGIEPPPDAVGVYNNTVYFGGAPDWVRIASVAASAANTIVSNNVISAPNAGSAPIILIGITPGAGINNLILPAMDFMDPATEDFRLNAGSSAIDTAIPSTRVREDGARMVRPPLPDCGALER
jgi:hypothetical protein